MKLIAVVQDIPTRQWLGRIINETGLLDRSSFNQGLNKVQFVRSIDEAKQAICHSQRCITLIWESMLSALDHKKADKLPCEFVLIDDSTTAKSLAGCFQFRERGINTTTS